MVWGDGGGMGGLGLQEGVAGAGSPLPRGGGWGQTRALWDEALEYCHVPGKVLGALQEETLSRKQMS